MVFKCLYKGTAVELINPGFTKAFDYVNHRLLLAKGLDFFTPLRQVKQGANVWKPTRNGLYRKREVCSNYLVR